MASFLSGRSAHKKKKFYIPFVLISFVTFNGLAYWFGDYNFSRILFISVFASIVTYPYFQMGSKDGKYFLLIIFLAFYFMMFGMGEFFHLIGLNDSFFMNR